jgi:hypothetical protein
MRQISSLKVMETRREVMGRDVTLGERTCQSQGLLPGEWPQFGPPSVLGRQDLLCFT